MEFPHLIIRPVLIFFALAAIAATQPGDLPVPPNLEPRLKQRGFAENLLPVQQGVLAPKAADVQRGWLVYHRDRNYEVPPNSKPAPSEAIDDVRYLETLEQLAARRDPALWRKLREEIRDRQKAMFDGIVLDNRIYSDKDFFVRTKNDDIEKLHSFVISQILEILRRSQQES